MAPNQHVLERLCELREEAYCKVLKCFVTSQVYDLRKELMLAQLRSELCISDERHEELRQCVSSGEDRPWLRGKAAAAGQRGGYAHGSSSGSEPPSPGGVPRQQPAGASPYQHMGGGHPGSANAQKRSSLPGALKPAKKRFKKGSAEPEGHTPPGGPSAPGEGQLMGMNPLVGHKVDRYWADDKKWWNGIITDYNGLSKEHCIVYDAGTASESYEWLDVAACSRDELHVLDDTVNVLDLSLPPSAQAQQHEGYGDPAGGMYMAGGHARGGQGGRKSGMMGSGRGPKAGRPGSYPGLPAKDSGVYPHQGGYGAGAVGRAAPARQYEALSSDDDDAFD